jgi:two-component system cell cycle response regulator
MGVNDYLTRPVDRNELLARVRTQMKRKRFADHLRGRLEESVELAATDALTGLHNRRYMEVHLKTLMDAARAGGRPLSVVVIDVDRFKSVNDTHGHDAGDHVLREVARRIQRNTRGIDLACRLGGEEFVIVMPDTGMERARQVGERVRACIAGEDFEIERGLRVAVTASVGVATLGEADTFPEMFKRADRALYAAKRGGRNRVVAAAA